MRGFSVALQWLYSGSTVALQWLYNGSTMNKSQCELHGQIEKRRTMNEQKTNKRRIKDEQ
ncbi:hypothetical protein HMPREF1321_0207 [Capnocytophaga sp. oral taxon 412 str. F0487]|uniref:hypothetical protein n=1 Tax=Capnocytophaga sp. oral taxon 412 TaxID=712218 RepID=UPI0002697437|nr:hypothetical protein [Capnocytophaga sp. oral taxon 412]EIW94340.1 hypothetical protein HMPREF1321_0207 [Capnocytophaga sp. oral taxon 412 str. F0487]